MACDLKASDLMTIHSEWHSSFDLLDLCELCMRRTAYSAYHVSLTFRSRFSQIHLSIHSLIISQCRCPDWLLFVAGLECYG